MRARHDLGRRVLTLAAGLALSASAAPAARAETYHVAPDGSDRGPGTASAPFRTLARGGDALEPGDTLVLHDGTYDEGLRPPRSGEAGAAITFAAAEGDAPIVMGQVGLHGRAHVAIVGLTLVSDGSADWVRMNDASSDLRLEGCRFESLPEWTRAYYGVHLLGDRHVIRGCAFVGARRGDVLRVDSSSTLVEGNDFALARGGHGMLNASASSLVIRRNYFTNPWDRISSISWNEYRGLECHDVLIEDNVYFDGNYDGHYPLPEAFSGENADPGAYYSGFRVMAKAMIIRNNLFAGMNAGRPEPNPRHPTIVMAPWSKNPHVVQMRIYHNTVYASAEAGLGAVWGERAEWRDIRIQNNLVADVLRYTISVAPSDGFTIPLDDLRFEGNLLFEGSTDRTVYLDGEELTVAGAEAEHPGSFAGNLVAEPVFADVAAFDAAEADVSRETRVAFSDLFLAEGSPGRGEALPLTRVRAAASASTRLEVDDAMVFCDGFGVVDGDEILIDGAAGPTRTRVVSRVDDHVLTVEPAVDASVGDALYLARYGSSPDVGVVDEEAGEEPDGGPEPADGGYDAGPRRDAGLPDGAGEDEDLDAGTSVEPDPVGTGPGVPAGLSGEPGCACRAGGRAPRSPAGRALAAVRASLRF